MKGEQRGEVLKNKRGYVPARAAGPSKQASCSLTVTMPMSRPTVRGCLLSRQGLCLSESILAHALLPHEQTLLGHSTHHCVVRTECLPQELAVDVNSCSSPSLENAELTGRDTRHSPWTPVGIEDFSVFVYLEPVSRRASFVCGGHCRAPLPRVTFTHQVQ